MEGGETPRSIRGFARPPCCIIDHQHNGGVATSCLRKTVESRSQEYSQIGLDCSCGGAAGTYCNGSTPQTVLDVGRNVGDISNPEAGNRRQCCMLRAMSQHMRLVSVGSALGAVLLGVLGVGWPTMAQETIRWSVVNCATSRIAGPQGLTCSATQNYSGAHGGWDADGGGTFRRWMSSGDHNGIKLYYYLAEATSFGASVREGSSLQDEIRTEMPEGHLIGGFSPLGYRHGTDYMLFTSPTGRRCVGIRRYGPNQGRGNRWILYGFRCDSMGRAISDEEIDQFIGSAHYRAE